MFSNPKGKVNDIRRHFIALAAIGAIAIAPACSKGGGSSGAAPGGNTGTDTGGNTGTDTGGNTGASTTTSPTTAPAAFALDSPANGSSAQPLTPTFQWAIETSAATYTLEVATTSTFGTADVIHKTGITDSQYAVDASSPLTAGIIYYWRVSAVNAGGSTIATGAPRWFSSPYLVPHAHGIGVTPDGAKLVVASGVNNGPIDIITLASHQITASISTTIASQPLGIAVSPDGTKALATLLTNGTGGVNGVSIINLTNNTLTGNLTDPCVATTLGDIAYFPSGNQAAMPDLKGSCTSMGLTSFIADTGSPNFSFVDFTSSDNPWGVALTPDGATAIVTMQLAKSVRRVTFPSTVTLIPVSSYTYGVAINPAGTLALVATDTGADVITLADNTITPIAFSPNTDTPNSDFHNVAITPDGAKAVVVGGSTIDILSLATKTVLTTYPASGGTSVAISTDGLLAFVTDVGNGWVRVIKMP